MPLVPLRRGEDIPVGEVLVWKFPPAAAQSKPSLVKRIRLKLTSWLMEAAKSISQKTRKRATPHNALCCSGHDAPGQRLKKARNHSRSVRSPSRSISSHLTTCLGDTGFYGSILAFFLSRLVSGGAGVACCLGR